MKITKGLDKLRYSDNELTQEQQPSIKMMKVGGMGGCESINEIHESTRMPYD